MKIKIKEVVKDLDNVVLRYTVLDENEIGIISEQDLAIHDIERKTIEDIKKELIDITKKYEKAQNTFNGLKDLEGKIISLNKETSSIEIK